MALGKFAPGYYTMTHDGTAIGLVEGVRRLRRKHNSQMFSADKWGLIDGVYKGGECFLSMIFKEWDAEEISAIWPFASALGDVGQNGRLLSDIAKEVILTAEAGTPAETHGPATITAELAILAPENDLEIILGNEQRDVPILFQLLPYDDSGTVRWFSITNPA
jgi:hypothetical protein